MGSDSLGKQYIKFLLNLPKLLGSGQQKFINDRLCQFPCAYVQISNKELNIICIFRAIGRNFRGEHILHRWQIDINDILKRTPECHLHMGSIVVKVYGGLVVEPVVKQVPLAKANRFTSRQLDRITTKRTRRITAYLHTASRRIIDRLVVEGIGTLVVGKNPLWKQEVEMGRKNNQQFVQLPHARFVEMLTYKAKLVGIVVVITEESYTSKASFLDRDPIPTYDKTRKEKPRFSGKREKRGLYRALDGRRINADINGSYNILRKAFPNSFGQGIEAPAVVPRRIAV